MSFKEITSLFRELEGFLNQDVRLEQSKDKPERYIEEVQKEINQTKNRISFHVN